MPQQYICIRECYYGLPGRRAHYRPGDLLKEGSPNRHFVKSQDFDPQLLNEWPRDHLHDKRSTVKIIQDLKHQFGVVLDPQTVSRKEAFERWRFEQDQKGKKEF